MRWGRGRVLRRLVGGMAQPRPTPADHSAKMPVARSIDPSRVAGALLVEQCDIPAELTLGEWRRQCAEERRAAADGARAARRGGFGRGLRRALRLG